MISSHLIAVNARPTTARMMARAISPNTLDIRDISASSAVRSNVPGRGPATRRSGKQIAALPGRCQHRPVTTTFLLTAFVIVATPGTGALFTIAAGLARGTRAALLAALACTLGTVPHMVAAITGLAAVLHASGVAFETIKYLGVAYLLWMAWSTWRDTGALQVEDSPRAGSRRAVIVSGITVNLLNPKLTIFFFAFLPQFVPASGAGATLQMLLLSGVFMAMTLVVFMAYGAAAGVMRDRVLSRPRLVDRIRKTFAASFAVLGARLATESR
jgi:threonine/homoserine/homoserine lactone efflux protein